MTDANALVGASGQAEAEAEALLVAARRLPASERGPLLDEADRLIARATDLAALAVRWHAAQMAERVASLTAMAREERARASSIRDLIEGLLRSVRIEAGLPGEPAAEVAPTRAPTHAPTHAPTPSASPAAPVLAASQTAPVAPVVPVAMAPAAPTPAPALSSPPPALAAAVDVGRADADLSKLHPHMRALVAKLSAALAEEGVPMRVFEACRAPERQRHLFAQGRTRPGAIVTNADAWGSFHQYGMAVDMVLDAPGVGLWEDGTPQTRAWWDAYHAIARRCGLEPLSFEKPHVQPIGMSIRSLKDGAFPEGGDESWLGALAAAVARFPDGAPALELAPERPPLDAIPGMAGLLAVAQSDWRSFHGGMQWRCDADGVWLLGAMAPLRSVGAPITAARIVELFGPHIAAASARHGVPPELIVMTVATETAAFREEGYTGPATFRWEPGVKLAATGDPAIDDDVNARGDYSAGPMQVLSSTARWVCAAAALDTAPDRIKWFRREPATRPKTLALYEPAAAIDIGAAYIRLNRERHATGDDPVLVAAAYNAGSLKPSHSSVWGLHAHGDHLDRAARWYGDACEVLRLAGR